MTGRKKAALAVGSGLAVLVLGCCGVSTALRSPEPVPETPTLSPTGSPAPTASPTPAVTTSPAAAAAVPPAPTPTLDTYYANCAQARASGFAPLHRGDPGYRSGLDRDGDGVACE